jgi:RNA polymerase sigma-70 factor (ECF subfamily)
MSSTVGRWLFEGWSFGRSPDETNTGRGHAEPFDPSETGTRTTEIDDDRIVAQVRAGDATALEAVFLRYYGPLVRFATSYVRSIDIGKEVVADVFAWVWEHRATWTPTAGVAAYLFGAVRNHTLNVMKSHAREHRRTAALYEVGDPPGAAAPPLNPGERVEHDDYTAALLRRVAKLPERRRLLLSLRWSYDLPWDQIAAVLGITKAAVKMEHRRILDNLRAELRDV